MKHIKAKYKDTLLEIARMHNLGYVEIRAANPKVDVWLPGKGTKITLPTRHLLPEVKREGIVINLAEMRLYSFVNDPDNPITHPIGVGRDGLGTPTGKTKITRKKEGPSWRPTPRMRKEDPDLPAVVPPGEDNPLGTHALYLGWPSYLIHGTHRPWGIGRRVSSGCIRMYPENIITVFESTPVGATVRVVDQPLKLAWVNETLYLEAHAEKELADQIEKHGTLKKYNVPNTLFRQLKRKLGAHYKNLDWNHVRTILKERRGYPVAVLTLPSKEEQKTKEKPQPQKKQTKTTKEAKKNKAKSGDKKDTEGSLFPDTVPKSGFN